MPTESDLPRTCRHKLWDFLPLLYGREQLFGLELAANMHL